MSGWLFLTAILVLSSFVSSIASADPGVRNYALQSGDVLEISVWKEADLTREVLVRPDGRMSFPLIGHLQASGRTPEQVESEIAQRLNQYIPDPVVTVSVLQVAGNKIYVIGKVAKPGEYQIGRYVDVMQALSLAGGLTPFASEKDIKVLRRKHEEQQVMNFNYAEVADGKNLEQDILLQSGDVVVVQ